jgi:hypothetical protein
MKCGWWQREIADEPQRFYCSLMKGERPKLVLMAPPQHGKTELIKDFIAWLAGKRPDLKTILASYSDELGVRVNMNLRRVMTSKRYVAIFGHAGFATPMCWSTGVMAAHFATPPSGARSPGRAGT